MRNIILCLLLFTALMGVTQAYGYPPGTYIGEFSIGEKISEFNILGGYNVGIVYRGAVGTTAIMLFFVSSPENPTFPGGYTYVSKATRDKYFIINFETTILYLAPTTDNRVNVWQGVSQQ